MNLLFIACGTKFLREFIFADSRFFCVLRELIFAIFRKYPVPSIDNIFVFVRYVQQKYILQYYGMRMMQVVIEQARFPST